MNGASDSTFSDLNKHSFNDVSPRLESVGIINSAISVNILFEIIFRKIQPLFSVDCGAILVYDDPVTVIKEAYLSTYTNTTGHLHTEIINQPFELTALQKTIAEFSFPIIKSEKEWIQEDNVNHCLLNGDSDYKYHCYIPLEINNQILGTLELHNYERELSTECLTFCSSIADFIADIIYLHRSELTKANISDLNPLGNSQKINSADNLYISNSPENLNKLGILMAEIEDINTLHEFVNKAVKLFPLPYRKIKAQLDEFSIYKAKLEEEGLYANEDFKPSTGYAQIIGGGRSMSKVFALMDQVAGSDSTVLILGETGTGKELIARAIHEGSSRKDNAMIKVNCAAIPVNLIESELFGHEKGSFTGATELRIGKFELANNGTLFLDEIGELPLDLQVKLLRALQEKEIERVGGKNVIKTDVRIVAATNRNLLTEVEQGRFRNDLYYRLNVFPISLPPLKDRPEDIPLLASYFLQKYGKQHIGFSRKAIRQMVNYAWPGNVREMEHLIERQLLMSSKPIISEISIPNTTKTITDQNGSTQKVKTIDENERDHIFEVLQLCKGRISGADGAAKLLGVPATTLNSKIKKLGLNKKHF